MSAKEYRDKIINYLEEGGERAMITRADRLEAALEGKDGTEFYHA